MGAFDDPARPAQGEEPGASVDGFDDEDAWYEDDEPLWRRLVRGGQLAVTLLGGAGLLGVLVVTLFLVLPSGRPARTGSAPVEDRAEAGLEATGPGPPPPAAERAVSADPQAPPPAPGATRRPDAAASGPTPNLPTPARPPAATPEAMGRTSARGPATPIKSPQRAFWVQVGAFESERNARGLAARLTREDYPVEVRRKAQAEIPWVVWVGGYGDRPQAEAARAALARKGVSGFVVEDERR